MINHLKENILNIICTYMMRVPQMLQVNEDMLAAIAEHQNWSDQGPFRSLETAHAYQLILHRNLIEMANFVDSLFGVFVNVVRHLHACQYTSLLLSLLHPWDFNDIG